MAVGDIGEFLPRMLSRCVGDVQRENEQYYAIIPIGSMYGIYANIGGILMVNVTIYSIHGSYGIWMCHIPPKKHLNTICDRSGKFGECVDHGNFGVPPVLEGLDP